MDNNQTYSKLAISFADFMNQIDNDIIKDKNGIPFKLEFIDNALKTGVSNPLRVKNKSNEARYFSEEGFTKPVARKILEKFEPKRLADYINDLLETDEDGYSAEDLCEDFFPNDESVNPANIAENLVEAFRNILKKRLAQKDERPKAKKEIKEEIKTQTKLEQQPYIEQRLKEALDIIFTKNPKTDLADFRMIPACLKDKIVANPPFKEKVDKMILPYYRYIEGLLKVKSEENPINFEHIASYIQDLYEDLKTRFTDQEDIFNAISETFINLTHHNAKKSTCEILTSFFIQNCEVFDAVAK